MDSRAIASVTPSTSKSTFAGRITATQDSSGPLPLPIRVSSGFLVKDFWGNTRIHIFPWRFMLRAMATRAASICFVSSQQRCSACKPYSPNATVWPRVAMPARLPRCILRYFTLSGIKGIGSLQKLQSYIVVKLHREHLLGSDRFGAWWFRFRGFGGFTFANPAFDTQFAINRFGLGETVINVGAKGMQRNTAPVVLLNAREFRATQAA